MVANPNFDVKMSRIMEQAAPANRDYVSRNLLHAYTACLSIEELCEATVRTFNSELNIRRAILTRLLRLGREKCCEVQLDQLGSRLLGLSSTDAKERRHINALLSHLPRDEASAFAELLKRTSYEDCLRRGTTR